MKTLKEIRELLDKAHQLRNDSTGTYRKFQDEFLQAKREIENSKDYTTDGKRKLIESLQRRKTVELLQGARNMRNEFAKHLTEAKQAADAIAFAKAPKVDPVKAERFEKRLAEVKTEILLSNAKRGKEKLTDFLNSIDEQQFAETVKAEFGTLIQPILEGAGNDGAKYRHELLETFEAVKEQAMHPEAKEAMDIVQFADSMIEGRFFIPLVEEKAQEHFSKEAGFFINRPDDFFAAYPDEDGRPIPPNMKTVEQIIEEEEAKVQVSDHGPIGGTGIGGHAVNGAEASIIESMKR